MKSYPELEEVKLALSQGAVLYYKGVEGLDGEARLQTPYGGHRDVICRDVVGCRSITDEDLAVLIGSAQAYELVW